MNPSLCFESVERVSRESRETSESPGRLACAASASPLYLKVGAYMAVESPTGGPNDVVFNTNGLALL